MKLKQIRDDTRGGTIVEYTLTMPLFILLMFGVVQAGILLWTWVGMQHGVEMAARCASVNYNANQAGLNTGCFSPTAPNAVTANTVEVYAANNSFGINLPSSKFQATLNTTCGTNPGILVTASYTFNLIHYVFSAFSVPLTAQSCYPTSS
jgi:Flp pilus assembly protein TadG